MTDRFVMPPVTTTFDGTLSDYIDGHGGLNPLTSFNQAKRTQPISVQEILNVLNSVHKTVDYACAVIKDMKDKPEDWDKVDNSFQAIKEIIRDPLTRLYYTDTEGVETESVS